MNYCSNTVKSLVSELACKVMSRFSKTLLVRLRDPYI